MTPPPQSQRVLVARQAMATRFEIVLHGRDPIALRAAGEEALDEVARLERQLSPFRADTEIARVNALAHQEPVRVSPPVFRLLETAVQLHRDTEGVFDLTVGPLLRCWGLRNGRRQLPSAAEVAEARASVGMGLVHLHPADHTVRFERRGIVLDLGALGKGYAVDKAADLLRAAGVTDAFIHGGTSTIYAMGCPPDQPAWKVALELPDQSRTGLHLALEEGLGFRPASKLDHETLTPTLSHAMGEEDVPGENGDRDRQDACPTVLAVVSLQDESLSVSAVWGRSLEVGGETYGHIMDPRTGAPARCGLMAAVVLPSATESDAFSTALLVLGPDGQSLLTARRPGMRTFLLHRQNQKVAAVAQGIEAYRGVPAKIPVEKRPFPP
jgi:FAD:protein FMN transferase